MKTCLLCRQQAVLEPFVAWQIEASCHASYMHMLCSSPCLGVQLAAGLKEILGGPTYVGMASPTQALVQVKWHAVL